MENGNVGNVAKVKKKEKFDKLLSYRNHDKTIFHPNFNVSSYFCFLESLGHWLFLGYLLALLFFEYFNFFNFVGCLVFSIVLI